MLVKRLAACTHLSSTVYEVWRDIGRKLQLFPTPLEFNAPVRKFRWGHTQQERQIEVGYTKNLRFSTCISKIPIPIPNTEVFQNTYTEYRYRLQIPIPTQLYHEARAFTVTFATAGDVHKAQVRSDEESVRVERVV